MGRHSSPEQWPFYRSVAGWFMPWILIAVVAGTAVWIAVDALGGGGLKEPVVASASDEPSETPTPTVVEETPTPIPVETPTPKPSRSPKPRPTEVELITEGVTVQVLNGTGSTDADDAMADRLAQLGFDVIAVDESSKAYEVTTVFWSSEQWADAARALADRFGWAAGPKPDNLSPEVSIHVVVGSDEA